MEMDVMTALTGMGENIGEGRVMLGKVNMPEWGGGGCTA